MPTYVYECAKCGDEFELWQSFSEDALKKHPGCGGKVTKVLQPVGIVLKGSGFYKNDSRSGANGRSRKTDGAGEKSGEKSGEKAASGASDGASSTSGDSSKKSDSSPKPGADKGGDKKASTPASRST